MFGVGLAFIPIVFVLFLALNHISVTKRNGQFLDVDKNKIYTKFKNELPDDFMNDNITQMSSLLVLQKI